jgi:hypothetical protein
MPILCWENIHIWEKNDTVTNQKIKNLRNEVYLERRVLSSACDSTGTRWA